MSYFLSFVFFLMIYGLIGAVFCSQILKIYENDDFPACPDTSAAYIAGVLWPVLAVPLLFIEHSKLVRAQRRRRKS